jgi:uncharacterized protein (DUF1684 family)
LLNLVGASCYDLVVFRVFATIFVSAVAILGGNGQVPANYFNSIRDWQEQQDAGLRAEDGWLTLVGLFWLKSGDNTIGSADSNDFLLLKGSAPAHVGRLRLESGNMVFINSSGSGVAVDNLPVSSENALKSDESDNPDIVRAGTVSFFVIKRGDQLGIRVKDTASLVLKNFQGLKYFPINPEFHFDAKFVPDPKKIPIPNILGRTEMEESPGTVEFTYKGLQYQLRPVFEGQTLFFLFKDPTNRTETYAAGRMLNTPLPVNGMVDLDFNKSYNPPCTFTPYATCPLPPKENVLPVPIEAGELRYSKGHPE